MKINTCIWRMVAPLTVLILLAVAACTHNDGDIGPIFGQWQLTNVEGGTESNRPADTDVMYWKFQSSVIEMYTVTPWHTSNNRFGNFRIADNTLFLDFPDSEGYGQPHLGLPRQCELQILRLDSKHLVVEYHPETDAAGVVFTFRKW